MFPTFHVFYVIELTRRSLNVDMLNYVSGKRDPKKLLSDFSEHKYIVYFYIYILLSDHLFWILKDFLLIRKKFANAKKIFLN